MFLAQEHTVCSKYTKPCLLAQWTQNRQQWTAKQICKNHFYKTTKTLKSERKRLKEENENFKK
jgi:hypothetical protein